MAGLFQVFPGTYLYNDPGIPGWTVRIERASPSGKYWVFMPDRGSLQRILQTTASDLLTAMAYAQKELEVVAGEPDVAKSPPV